MSEQNISTGCKKLEKSDIPKWKRIWLNNQGAILILIAEGFASAMDAIARYLQQGERDSVHYLPLAEATIFRFLVPLLTAFTCSIFLHQPLTRKDFLLSILALVGIIIIAHPASIMGDSLSQAGAYYKPIFPVVHISSSHADATTPLQRIIAVIVATIGVLGGAGAYTTIRLIGKRAHALHSVIYYSFFCTVSSAFFLLVLPGMSFKKPQGLEWFMLLLLGLLGFGLQFLLTRGLQLDPSNKATSMMYSQVIYATLFDWLIWRVLPDKWGMIGGAIVIGSTLWSALTKPNIHSHKEPCVRMAADEESPLLGDANMRQAMTGCGNEAR
ncbi:hypothetical protein EPUL_006372 [Erysiphe pulchra]|uniref:EamA domain-containing protein n=1 Tax=Erysiphe pulchra TaxID=225359 RepID=A0A2S4PN03_9PEZI|nr:hypothetical protein EPUL_006372 [Erysiphe pulchra]